ncbi:MAG: hypothetical protein HRU41_21335 [Saprospiraceae bacterium]|nr:hypothetical protein [Saprospiraceae bacterium]
MEAKYHTPLVLSGPFRQPKQMLLEQEYGGHKSLHDGGVATDLGLKDAPIEGPTHFSQFVPLLVKIWGKEWYESGCFSAHFLNMVVEGEEVKAFVEWPEEGQTRTRCWAEKADGSLVLEASASLGNTDATLLDQRMAKLRPINKLVILEDLAVGQQGNKEEEVMMEANQHMGKLYPFSLSQKLDNITESSPFYTDANQSLWDREIIPLEMVSVLSMYTFHEAGFVVKQPSIGLFADLEIRMIKGPLLVGETYKVRREIVALGESRRTEGFWTRSQILDETGQEILAEVLLHQAVFKHSYPDYPTTT